ncbi:SH3 domain-binding protein 5 (SH3BP5) domain-containing protein [Phthorimaea operculella]|nr:SH3 domain-binding protein 5 (SH3BP5) domain-containing protein [Phthorimaea operculella]
MGKFLGDGPYFEEKARINAALETQKARIQTLEEQVSEAKQQYSSALRNLERISDEIHKHRSRRHSAMNGGNELDRSTITDTASDTNTTTSDKLEELCDSSADASVVEWLRRTCDAQRPAHDPDTWTEIDLDSSPEERPAHDPDTWTEIDLDSSPEEVSETHELEELCDSSADASVVEWLRRTCDAQRPAHDPDTWTEIDLDSSPEEPRRSKWGAASDTNTTTSDKLEELCDSSADASVVEWLRRTCDAQRPAHDPDTWTEIDLDSSPEEVSFEKCSLRPRSTPEKLSPPSPMESKVSAASPRRIIRTAALRAELEKGRRQSLDVLIHDTGEKMKEMFQGSSASDERYSDTDSLASMEMLSDDQIASLMLDAQLEAVCERLAGVAAIDSHKRY